jgi:hypothetical protein
LYRFATGEKNLLLLFIVLLVGSITILMKIQIVPLSNNPIYGPFRWWNNEVVSTHTAVIIQNYFSLDGLRALFAPVMPSTAADGYRLLSDFDQTGAKGDAAGSLRFVEGGSAYVSFPPLAFFLYAVFSGFLKITYISNNVAVSLMILNSLMFVLTTWFYARAGLAILEKKGMHSAFNKILVLFFTIVLIIFSPQSLYMLGVNILWVHSLLLLLISYLTFQIANNGKRSILVIQLCVVILPFISYSTLPIQISLLFILHSLYGIRFKSCLKYMIFPYLILATWVLLTFESPINWFKTITQRTQSRILIDNVDGESTSYFASLWKLQFSLFSSFGLAALILCLWLLYRFLSKLTTKQKFKLRTRNGYISILAFSSIIEAVLIPGHAHVYSFAQIMFIPILWSIGMSFLLKHFNSSSKFGLHRVLVPILCLTVLAFINVGLTKVLYNTSQSYDVVTNDGLKEYQLEHT